jgi:hypothetical protein
VLAEQIIDRDRVVVAALRPGWRFQAGVSGAAMTRVMQALKAGERPTDVTAWSTFTATYVRKLARAHGIEAQPGSGVPKGGTETR